MNAAELSWGLDAAVRVNSTSGAFQSPPRLDDEVHLISSAGQALLHAGDQVWSVEGATATDHSRLFEVIGSGMPFIAWVAQSGPDTLLLETRRFMEEHRIMEPMELGLDEKVIEDVRRSHKKGGTTADVANWLQDCLFMPPAPGGPPGLRRMIVSSGPSLNLKSFRIHGLKVTADVRRVDKRLHMERVGRGGNSGHARLLLMYAPVTIVDATVASELHGAVRTTLSEAVSRSNSYLRIWQEYHALEDQNVKRRARDFGVLAYDRVEEQRNGSWRFHLRPSEVESDSLAARLARLEDWERYELVADQNAPPMDDSSSRTGADTQRSKQKKSALSSQITFVDPHGRFLDLAAQDEDEEPLKPPANGVLYLSTSGDKARLERRRQAEEALRTGNCPMPQLGLLMEGRPVPASRRQRISVDGPRLKAVIRELFGKSGPTPRQLEAIEHALNTPDICLIQGPPGTGKTKVITAIERCVAVLADEGAEQRNRILVSAAQHDAVENVAQRTEVFGLPAMKVGRRRKDANTGIDIAEVFARDRLAQLESRLREPLEAERLSQARHHVLTCIRHATLPAEQPKRLREVVRLLDGLLAPALRDRALERASALERPHDHTNYEEQEAWLNAARAIRVDAGPFSDDGPVKARKALQRLDSILTPEERAWLERCADAEPETTPPWLEGGRSLRDALLDRLMQPPPAVEPGHDDETHELLLNIMDEVELRMITTRVGEDAVVASYAQSLETDPNAVRDALEHYTVVVAATLQQAAGSAMRELQRIQQGNPRFDTVIIDEAARAHPLDLFIPLSMAGRRVVLVGDHRQLPHLLEPDVERQLADSVEQGTVEKQTLDAVHASLFERLWVMLRNLEQRDGIRRTVTLNAQYRMHPVLGQYVSREYYEVHGDGKIESPRGADEFSHDLPGYTRNGRPCAAAWLNVPYDRGGERRGASKSRPSEAQAIAREVHRLIEHDMKLSFGVIAFYRAQVDAIGEAMLELGLTERTSDGRGWRVADRWASGYDHARKSMERLRIGTVDAFQGKEFDVVFLSVTRSNELPGQTEAAQRRKFGHLMLENRLCVAMSRQQRLLVVAGDLAFIKAEDARQPLRSLRAFVTECGGEHGIIR